MVEIDFRSKNLLSGWWGGRHCGYDAQGGMGYMSRPKADFIQNVIFLTMVITGRRLPNLLNDSDLDIGWL